MKPTYYLKTIKVKSETLYKVVANYGDYSSYLLGKELTWADLQEFVSFDTRLVIDGNDGNETSYYKFVNNLFGRSTSRLYLAPGFRATRNTGSIEYTVVPPPPQKAATPKLTLPKVPKLTTNRAGIPCAGSTGSGCGPSFFTEYPEGIESAAPSSIHAVSKKSFWEFVFGDKD